MSKKILGLCWFPWNSRKKYMRKEIQIKKRKKNERKIKNKCKINKLFLYITLKLFNFFLKYIFN